MKKINLLNGENEMAIFDEKPDAEDTNAARSMRQREDMRYCGMNVSMPGVSAVELERDWLSRALTRAAFGRETIVIVSRHKSAISWIASHLDWCESNGVVHAKRRDKFGYWERKPITVIEGNATGNDCTDAIVVGNIPLKLAAVAREVFAIEFDGAPPRGVEYTSQDMAAAGARLVGYRVELTK